jgi:NAD(P)H-dependent flavin oxidoreductase YrpB (nitropropane dioxygenase family)
LNFADPLARFRDRMSLPLIAAPMFLVSSVDLVVAACRNGVIGAFPTVNCRSSEQLDSWLSDIEDRLARRFRSGWKAFGADLSEPDRASFQRAACAGFGRAAAAQARDRHHLSRIAGAGAGGPA